MVDLILFFSFNNEFDRFGMAHAVKWFETWVDTLQELEYWLGAYAYYLQGVGTRIYLIMTFEFQVILLANILVIDLR